MADLPNVNALEIETFKRIAQGHADGPVFMLNLNKYRAEAPYPSGQLYQDYMAVLDQLLLQVGGKILWRTVGPCGRACRSAPVPSLLNNADRRDW